MSNNRAMNTFTALLVASLAMLIAIAMAGHRKHATPAPVPTVTVTSR